MKFTVLFCLLLSIQSLAQPTPELGVVSDLHHDSLLHTSGYKYLVESTQKILSPRTVSEQEFQTYLKTIKKLRMPLLASNLFIPGDLKVVGPNVDEKEVLAYVEVVFQRAKAAKLSMIIWGSGGSRTIPEGFDRAKAKTQFIGMAKKIGALAAKYNITLALESLNSTECNFITTVKEAVEIVKAVNHKNIKVCVDIYHMLKEGEATEAITLAKRYVVYCEVAEREGRTPPGTKGDDFTGYLAALKKINYRGKIIIECRWNNLSAEVLPARLYLQAQLDSVWRK